MLFGTCLLCVLKSACLTNAKNCKTYVGSNVKILPKLKEPVLLKLKEPVKTFTTFDQS